MAYYNSRLTRIEERRNIRKATLLVGLVIFVVVLLAIYGVPVLVRLVNIVAPKSTRPTSGDTIAPIPPQITLPYAATNSATIALSGLAEPGSTIFLSLNGNSQQATTDIDGKFSFSEVKLIDGSNTITAVAMDAAGNRSQPSNAQNLLLITKLPEIKIDSPTDLAQINDKTVTVSGSLTGQIAKLVINGKLAAVSADNKFSYVLNLQSGSNPIIIDVTDQASNTARKEISVTSTQ